MKSSYQDLQMGCRLNQKDPEGMVGEGNEEGEAGKESWACLGRALNAELS